MKKNKIILNTVVGVMMLFTFIGLSLITSGGVVYAVSDSTCAPGTICNPLGSTNTLNQVLNIIISTVQVIAGIISVVYIILAGLKFILAGGDPAKIKKARDMLLYVVIGIAIIFGAQAISIVVQTTIEQVGSGQQ
jgi:type IV secretory pathway VirB2 component (pilin)